MANELQPRFKRRELVQYMGSIARLQGWLFEIVSIHSRPPRYELYNEAWGVRIGNVRESSLRGPDD
jgi:hypothetical protein